ncbi:SNF2 helicase-associated domain-containing protein [Sodalis sp.]|uniref:SNF2 helicase-associated domain-containing protein n=1 Tax=Sodalis sp. (in: enterobacteria) TaxID=1898979 RepID=UPI003872F0C8
MQIWSEFNKEKQLNTKILSLLFGNHPERFDDPGEEAIGPALHTWLARYHLAERNYVPVLSLDESVNGNFAVALAVQPKSALSGPPVSLHHVLTDEDWSQHRFGVLQTVVLLAEFFPPLDNYLRQGACSPIELTSEQLPELLFNTLPAIQLLGIRTLLPKALERLLRPRLSMKVSSKAPGLTGGYLGADDILNFDWRVALGAHQLTRTEFERLVHDATGIVQFKGEYVYLDPEEIARIKNQLVRPSELSGTELLRIALAGEYSGTQVFLDDNMQQLLKELRETDDVPLPNDLKATLRPYQQRGYT